MEKVTLWNGNTYDRDKVVPTAPHLLAHFDRHSDLVETVDVDGISIVRRWMLSIVCVSAAVAAATVCLGRPFIGWSWVVACISFATIGYVAVVFGLSRIRGATRVARTVSVSNGEVCVATPFYEKRASLSKCAWFAGLSWHDPLTFSLWPKRCVVLFVPSFVHGVAVGLKPGLFEVWTELLEISELPKGRDQHAWQLIVVIFGVVRGAVAGAAIAGLITLVCQQGAVCEFLRIYSICTGPLIGGLYATIRTGSSWWCFKSDDAFLSTLVWFAVPSIGAAAWASSSTVEFVCLFVAGCAVQCPVFFDLRRRAMRQIQIKRDGG